MPNTRPQWMELAEGELGISEYVGTPDNPRIVEYHKTTSLPEKEASQDETPWCSSFVNWCITRSGLKGTNSAWSKSWLDWKDGERIEYRMDIQYGDILIFERPPNPNSGHVGFFIGWSEKNNPYSDPIVLGGNQGDKVSKAIIRMELLAARRPQTRKPLIKSRTVATAVTATATATAVAGPTVVETIKQISDITTASKPLVDLLTTQNITAGVIVMLMVAIGMMLYFYLNRRQRGING